MKTKGDVLNSIKCFKCDSIGIVINGIRIREKYRICEVERAKQVLVAIKHLKDESAAVRLADIDSVERLIAQDLYYHNNCLALLLSRYQRLVTKCLLCAEPVDKSRNLLTVEQIKALIAKSVNNYDDELSHKIREKFDEERECVKSYCYAHKHCEITYISSDTPSTTKIYENQVTPMIEELIDREYGLPVSSIRDFLSAEHPNSKFYNHKIKKFIVDKFCDQVSFCKPYRKSDSEVVFSSSIDAASMIQKLQVLNEVKSAGSILRRKLRGMTFGLEDRFCDAVDLQTALRDTRMPESVMDFLGGLLNISKATFLKYQKSVATDTIADTDDETEYENDETESVLTKCPKKILKANSLFQVMHHMANNGEIRTPFHIMHAHAIYHKSHSRELITASNHLGFCISYPELLRLRALLGIYIMTKYLLMKVSLPSHFDENQESMVGIDNFDHNDQSSITGKNETHDSVLVMYQNVPFSPRNYRPPTKGRVSHHTDFVVSGRKYISKLPFQKLMPFYLRSKEQPLPSSFRAEAFHYETDESKEKVLNLTRNMSIPLPETQHLENVPTWAGCEVLTSTINDIPLKTVGYLPIFPHPITKIETVYSLLQNCASIAALLKQKTLPVICDEGVYHLVTKIYLQQPDVFERIFPFLGGFHLTKSALRCAGKFVRGSGVEDAYIECNIFGPKTVEAVMSGSHYYRSFDGLMMLGDALTKLKMEAFWKEKSTNDYSIAIQKLEQLQCALVQKSKTESTILISELQTCKEVKRLMDDIEAFSIKCGENSAQCKFWLNFVKIMDTIKDFVRSERDGDFFLNMNALERILPIFLGCDAVNYLRYGSFHLELLKRAKTTHPELYDSFIRKNFVVKRTPGSFNAVSPDLALEQTINKSAKSSHGIIGNTKSADYVAEWCLIYHEELAITNAYRDVTNSNQLGNSEMQVHHHLRPSKTKEINGHIQNLADYISLQGNPFLQENHGQVKNIVTQVYGEEYIADQHCQFFEQATEKYNEFHKLVYVDKTRLLSDKITKHNLLPIDHVPSVKFDDSSKAVKRNEKSSRMAIKTLNIAKEKKGDLREVLQYDLTRYNPLFDGMLMEKPRKHEMTGEVESRAKLTVDDYKYLPGESNSVVIDFMSFIRGQNLDKAVQEPSAPLCFNLTWKHVSWTFGSMIAEAFARILKNNPTAEVIHIIFDSYLDLSLKSGERRIRLAEAKGVIRVAMINENTKVPEQMGKFWPLSDNKVKFQRFAKSYLLHLAKRVHRQLIVSGTVDGEDSIPAQHLNSGMDIAEISELQLPFEEADMRLIPHIQWDVINCSRSSVTVVSDDTDVLILLLFYFKHFSQNGLQKLYLQKGRGSNKKMFPIHTMYSNLGEQFCKTLLKAHLGTGADYLSKIGTKKSSLNANPEVALKEFGEKFTLDEEQIQEAELYLVQVAASCRSTCLAKTFDELRVITWKRTSSVLELEPTSHSIIEGHIKRWWFLYKVCSDLLDMDYTHLQPTDFGWVDIEGELFPCKNLNLLPDDLFKTCKCKTGCQKKVCSCFKAEGQLKCTDYCLCVNCNNR